MIIIRRLNEFGTCMCCGTGSDDGMMRVTLQYDVADTDYMQGTSFCLCSDCMKHFQQQIRNAVKGDNI